MKRPIIVAAIFATVIALTIWGDRLVGRALDNQLGPLLTRELGLPVTLGPIKARVLNLKASTPKLVMGDPNDPAVVATDVTVTLAWSDLLNREIRLVTGSGKDLVLNLSNWPGNDDPWPDNYRFLEQWLPRELTLESMRYVAGDGAAFAIADARWQRLSDGSARTDWSQAYAGSEITLDATLHSLDALLNLAPLNLDLELQAKGKPESRIMTKTILKPGESSGYVIEANVETSGLKGKITSGNSVAWQLPESSATTIDELLPDKLQALAGLYGKPGDNEISDAPLAATLPVLTLPEHRGTVSIAEIRLGDELGKDTSFSFNSSANTLEISRLSSTGPTGILSGQLRLHSDEQGWDVRADAKMTARESNESIAAQHLGADWMWQEGDARLQGKGGTWAALLYSLEGNVNLAGHHQDKVKTPVKITAVVANNPGALAVENLQILLGEASIKGTVSLSGDARRQLGINLAASGMDLDFLFEEPKVTDEPGIPIPEYLALFPQFDIDAQVTVTELITPAIQLSRAQMSLKRTPRGGLLTLEGLGKNSGEIGLRLEADRQPGGASKVDLETQLDNMDIAALFQQETLLHSRSTGTISLRSEGNGLANIFKALQGKAALSVEFRKDDNWERATEQEERLQFSSNATMIIEGDRILGLKFENLDIDSIEQDITGNISIAPGREPWLEADFLAEKLDVNGLLALLPESPQAVDDKDVLHSLKEFGAATITLEARSLQLRDLPLTDLSLQLASAKDRFTIDRLDFSLEGRPLKSHGDLNWKGKQARLEASAAISDFDLDRFLVSDPNIAHIPVSGSLRLESEGEKFAEMLANLQGQIKLAASGTDGDKSAASRRQLDMQVERRAEGMHAEVEQFAWGENELSGTATFHQGTPPRLKIEIASGTLSLIAWEDSTAVKATAQPGQAGGSTLGDVAEKSASFVGNILSSPARMVIGPGEAAPGDKFFNSEPLPLANLKKFDAEISGRLDAIYSRKGSAKQLELSGALQSGKLELNLKSGDINQGTAAGTLAVDTMAAPPTASLVWSFENIHGKPDKPAFPRSGYLNLSTFGASEAEMASHLTGHAYLELGTGPYDYQRGTLLTAEVASTVMQSLIPGLGKQAPELQCGVTLAVFNDGMGVTPYGYALRTATANIIGRMEVDLKKELMQLQFDSSNRKGVGISVSSVFSNTVRLKGPLTAPEIVPNTTGILWRGWAAFMTAGLSVVGESVIKRGLASEDPCKTIKKEIHKDMCTAGQPLTASPLACPPAQQNPG